MIHYIWSPFVLNTIIIANLDYGQKLRELNARKLVYSN